MSHTPWPGGHPSRMPYGENHPATILPDPRFNSTPSAPANTRSDFNVTHPNNNHYSTSTTKTTTFPDGTTVTSTTNVSGPNATVINQDAGFSNWGPPGHPPRATYQPYQPHWPANQNPSYNGSPYSQGHGTYPWGNPLPATQYQAESPSNQNHYQQGQAWGHFTPPQVFESAWPGSNPMPDTTPNLTFSSYTQINTLQEAQWALKMTILPPNSKLTRITEEWWVDIGGGVLRRLTTVLGDPTMRAQGGAGATGQVLGEVDEDLHSTTANTRNYPINSEVAKRRLISWSSTAPYETETSTEASNLGLPWGVNLTRHMNFVKTHSAQVAKYKELAVRQGSILPPGCVREHPTGILLFDCNDPGWLQHVTLHLKAQGYSDRERRTAWVDTSFRGSHNRDQLKQGWHGDMIRNSYDNYRNAREIRLKEKAENRLKEKVEVRLTEEAGEEVQHTSQTTAAEEATIKDDNEWAMGLSEENKVILYEDSYFQIHDYEASEDDNYEDLEDNDYKDLENNDYEGLDNADEGGVAIGNDEAKAGDA